MTDETSLDAWTRALIGELGLDIDDVDVAALLDVARDAAHAVARPAAPLTTFLVGYAVARGASVDDASAVATTLARRWTDEMPG